MYFLKYLPAMVSIRSGILMYTTNKITNCSLYWTVTVHTRASENTAVFLKTYVKWRALLIFHVTSAAFSSQNH